MDQALCFMHWKAGMMPLKLGISAGVHCKCFFFKQIMHLILLIIYFRQKEAFQKLKSTPATHDAGEQSSGTSLTAEDATNSIIANIEHLANKTFLTSSSNDKVGLDGQRRTWKVTIHSKDLQTGESSYGVVFLDMLNESLVILRT
jgi:hypothetical protein